MPIFGIGKSLCDIEPHRYENWGSISGSGLSGSVENSLSRSQRCFQIENAGETNHNQNYFSTTRNLTPGPGAYRVKRSDPQVGPYSPEFSFGNSTKERTLSESNRLWAPSDLSTPSPNAYNVRKSSTEEYLKNLLGVTKWKLKKLQRELKTSENLTKFQKRTISDEIKLLSKRVKAITSELAITPPPISPIKKNKNAFVTTDLKPHQKPDQIQESPTFYMNEEKEWDFGSENRGLNIHDMGSFGYSKKFVENKEFEDQSQADIITGSARPKSRCRSTDFFGPNKDFRNEVPSVGEYTPELVPTNYLYGMSGTIKSGFDDYSRGGTLSTHTSWNTMKTGGGNGRSFNFSRSLSVKTPLSTTLPSHVNNPRITHASNNNNDNHHLNKTSNGRGSRRNSNCSDITLDALPSPGKDTRAK